MDAKSIHSYDILWPISAFLHTLGEGRGEAMLALLPYDRAAAVRYAHIWAYGRNPRYYDYESIGGDCTNFASQCIYAGAGVMNDTPTFGWYYINANDKAPAWTGVEYLYNFLTRRTPSAGPFAGEVHPAGRYRAALVRRRRLAAFAGRRGGGPSAQLCGYSGRRAQRRRGRQAAVHLRICPRTLFAPRWCIPAGMIEKIIPTKK